MTPLKGNLYLDSKPLEVKKKKKEQRHLKSVQPKIGKKKIEIHGKKEKKNGRKSSNTSGVYCDKLQS